MGEVTVEDHVDTSADRVWELVRDFGGLVSWNPGMESCELEGEGIGAVRKIKVGGIEVHERLEKSDDAARSFSYAIIAGPIPAENYLATMTIEEAGPNRAKITWGATFDAKGVSDEDCAKLFAGIYNGGIEAMRQKLC